MSSVERDVKPRNMNFAKVEKRGGAINREGAFITKNTVGLVLNMSLTFDHKFVTSSEASVQKKKKK